MLNNNENGLNIFENFSIDKTLPKYRKESAIGKSSIETSGNISWGVPVESQWSDDVDKNPSDYGWGNKRIRILEPIFKYIKRKQQNRIESKKKSVLSFFDDIQSACMIEDFDPVRYKDRVEGYLKSINNAKDLHQTALVESLSTKLEAVKMESLLYGYIDPVKIITEQQVVQFVKESEKGIRLDWIKNFARIIPSDIATRKIEFDNLNVFDNYVVMHYDPDGKAWKDTYDEKQKRKDPILFGVIKDMKKLYVIGDWKDEYCDLTVTDFIDKFGINAIEANNITVNV